MPPAAPPTSLSHWTITQLAAEFGVTTRTLRFYEEQGLVSPLRDGSTRRYTRRDRARLAWICRAKRVGFSLAEIHDMIVALADAPDRAGARAALAELCRTRLEALERQRREIDGMQAELAAFLGSLGQSCGDHRP